MTTSTATVDIPALKRRHPLGDVVEMSGVRLRGRGRVRQGVCPFHEEREGSFTVYADTQRFYCFGCGLGGDVLDFIQRSDGVGLPEAIRRLEGDSRSPAVAPTRVAEPQPEPPPAIRDPALLTAAMRCYARQLQLSEPAQAYLAARGIGAEAAQRLGLGYASGQGLRSWLNQAGFDDRRILRSGLVRKRRERFRGMIVVPDVRQGRVHWLAGRSIRPDAKPRFQALPGPKPVLGLHQLDGQSPWIVVAEGLFDWLVLAAWGLPACAALGAQGLDRVASALKGRSRIFLAFDADEAGRDASAELAGLLGAHRAAIVNLPEGVCDVGELGAHPDGRAVFLDQLRRAATAAR